ncbi:MAG TPA: hypothetical protein DIW80_03885 [Gordonia polyisoprenivorans]|uniref:hypothetical protein n=1 Tax=Gordonia polyisoprenivorans TaxID=84595 RepID=UPI000EE62DBB|nr:hypothetical protein [Gordonia polyisoprenivorans]UZF54329.1 hypothetical protein LH935_16405 [Gordonia polyisoprenivorans]HCS56517.1 hypothetical protein [Gordonia polyisoprenivorans]
MTTLADVFENWAAVAGINAGEVIVAPWQIPGEGPVLTVTTDPTTAEALVDLDVDRARRLRDLLDAWISKVS